MLMDLFPPAPGEGKEVDYGYKGKGVLIHFLSERNGHPIAVCTTSAKGDERKMVFPLINRAEIAQLQHQVALENPMIILEADRGYDAAWLRQKILNIGILPMIPYRGKKNMIHREICQKLNLKSERWKVERTIVWFKRKARRMMCRWERVCDNWDGMVTMALIFYWMAILVR